MLSPNAQRDQRYADSACDCCYGHSIQRGTNDDQKCGPKKDTRRTRNKIVHEIYHVEEFRLDQLAASSPFLPVLTPAWAFSHDDGHPRSC